MLRASLAIVALLSACDEGDPATSEHCVQIRMQHINMVFWRNRIAEGPTGAAAVPAADAMIARFVSAHWQCFR